MLIFSVYVPPLSYRQISKEVSMQPTLDDMQATIQDATRNTTKPTKIILAGDFNRHYPAWSGRQVHHQILRNANELLAFTPNRRLQWCLPSGTPTLWSLTHPGVISTIDLTLTDSPERVLKCHLYQDNYGSDHRATTFSEWNLQPELRPNQKPRRAFERADWEKIGKMIQTKIGRRPDIGSVAQLEQTINDLIEATTAAIEKYTPRTRPSPYSKRWVRTSSQDTADRGQ